ncbi:hypothetical protein [Aquimarina aquimarini]|uniref:hypothetical protein n=1 Tax=Aquimarina aquimarini TaxID=1191734 RepID=UPI000D562740|nr:hypothetical protein [Aquimarina aquimarini]
MRIIKVTIFFAITAIIISCGYTKTEDDKFPNMAVFPESSNPEITIKPLKMKMYDMYSSNNATLFAAVNFFYDDGATGQYIMEMDDELNRIDSIPRHGDYFIAKNGNFYLEDENRNVVKYNNLKSEPQKIPTHPFHGKLYKDNLEKELKEKGAYALNKFPDSLHYEISRKIDSISYHKAADEFNKQVLTNLECVRDIGGKYLLTYPQNEFIIEEIPTPLWDENIGNRKRPYELLHKFDQCRQRDRFIIGDGKELIIKDKAVTANGSSGGNHFVPGTFYPKGYQYYEFSVNNETTQFKIFAEYVLAQKITSRNIPNTNTYLLDVKHERYDYDRSVTYIVRKE